MKGNELKKLLLFFILLPLVCVPAQKNAPNIQKIADGFSFPEGPAYDGKNAIYLSNCHGDWIARLTLDGKKDTFQTSSASDVRFGQTNGMAFFSDGSLYATDYKNGTILKFIPSTGRSEIILNGYNGKKFNRPNDMAFDWKGSLFFTDPSSYDVNRPDGCVYMFDRNNNVLRCVIDSLCFPNGIAFSPDKKYLFVCESAKQRVLRFDVNGDFRNFSVFCELPGGDPDGLAFDKSGNLYIAHFGGGNIYVYSPDGKLKEKISTPGKKPSNLEFAGRDMKTLVFTEDETNAVYKIRVKIPGFRLFSSPARQQASK